MARASVPIVLGVVVFTLAVGGGGIALLRTHCRAPADLPVVQAPPALRSAANSAIPAGESVPARTPVVAAAPPTTQPTSSLQALLGELNAELPKLGVRPPAQLTAATVENNLLVLTFSAAFRDHLADRSALDELTAALSQRVQAHGYRNLDLRVADSRGRVRSVAEFTTTPPARRPRPEPIDDGVRR